MVPITIDRFEVEPGNVVFLMTTELELGNLRGKILGHWKI
jgi:hypothetical protein